MRHKVAHRKLGRKSDHRLALLRNLCTSLIVHERLITTLPKAKELRPFAEDGFSRNLDQVRRTRGRLSSAPGRIGAGHVEVAQRGEAKVACNGHVAEHLLCH